MAGDAVKSRAARGRRAVLCFLAIAGLSHAALYVGKDSLAPGLADPEYARKFDRLRRRQAEAPGRPLMLFLGSSRVSMGIRPDLVAAHLPGPAEARPLPFNFGLIGSGPVMELMCLRRLLADGVRPARAVIEVWPPFMHIPEEGRIDPARVRPADLSLLRRYHRDEAELLAGYSRSRWNPYFQHRYGLVSQFMPEWLPWSKRRDAGWAGMDGWGFLPGPADGPGREARLVKAREFYEPILTSLAVPDTADRATRELLALCRTEAIPARLLVLPESTEFRSWYGEAGRAVNDGYLRRIAEDSGLPLIDARDWMPDALVADGFHLTQNGAAVFSQILAERALGDPP